MKRNKRHAPDHSEGHLNDSGSSYLSSSVLNSTKSLESISGKIENIQMTNFMCHSNLQLELNSKINFITGKNGSGKSAIMAALVIVLGGTASITGRGSSVTDFIKKGENWAKVSVTLTNEGANSFKKEVYGRRITICRTISRPSNSKNSRNSYLCKSEKGVLVSKKKEEVDNIVMAFNLQIKNPICVLNQDVSRNFLCASDSRLRFTMFMKATQLEDLKLMIVKTLESLVLSKKLLLTKEKEIEEKEQEMRRLKEKLEFFASLEKYAQERTGLENEFMWSLVVSEENKVNELEKRRDTLEKKKHECVKEGKNFRKDLEELEKEVQEWLKRKQEVKNSRNEVEVEKGGVQKELRALEREIEKTEAQWRGLVSKTESKLKDIEGVKKYLKEKDAKASQRQAEIQEANDKISGLRERLSEIKNEVAAAQRDVNNAGERKFQYSRSIENSKADLGELEQNKKRLEILLSTTKGREQNNLLKYGPYTQELVEAIEEAARNNQFLVKPVGPCGRYVTLSGDPKWARAVESVIGGLMSAYCCDNSQDFQVLSRIMDQISRNRQPSIIISKFLRHRHNVETQKVSVNGLNTVLDVLKFDSDVVFNTFIDQARIETILLFENDTQAASFSTHIQNVPKNLRKGVTMQSDEYYPAPNYRTYYGDTSRPLKYFEDSFKGLDAVKELEVQLREAQRAVQKKNAEIMKAKTEYLEVCDELNQSEMRLRQSKRNEVMVQVELNQLKDIEECRPVVKTVIVLEEELQSLEESYREASKKASLCRETLDSLNAKKREHAEKLNALALREVSAEKELEKIERKSEDKKFEHQQLQGRHQTTNSRLAEIDNELSEVETEIRKSEAALQKKVTAAKNICPERINTERSPVEVQKLLEKCESYLKSAEKVAGSKEGAIAQYKAQLELFKDMKKMAKTLISAIESFSSLAHAKERRLHIVQSHTASMVSFYFQAVLQTRGYDGQLKVDFENVALDLEVKPKDASVARKDSKTLSGGERSYSTVAFILAIWKAVNMPVYFLDEFDVYMDKMNRKVIMDLLLEHATNHSIAQFVFITPQDVSGVPASDVVSVFRLPDPVRRPPE